MMMMVMMVVRAERAVGMLMAASVVVVVVAAASSSSSGVRLKLWRLLRRLALVIGSWRRHFLSRSLKRKDSFFLVLRFPS